MSMRTTIYLTFGIFIILQYSYAEGTSTTMDSTTDVYPTSASIADTSPEFSSTVSTGSSTGSTEDITGSSPGETPETTGSSTSVTEDSTGSSSGVTQETTESSSVATSNWTENSTAVTEDNTGTSAGGSQEPTGSSTMVTSGSTESSTARTEASSESSSEATQEPTGSSSEMTPGVTVSTSAVTDDNTGSSSLVTSDTTEDPGHTPDSSATSASVSFSTSTRPTVSTLSSTTPKYEYDTSEPDLNGAVYTLLLRLEVEADLTETTAVATDIRQQFNVSFTDMEGFKRILVSKIRSDVATFSESTILELTVHFSARDLVSSNKTSLRREVESRVTASSSSPVLGVAFTVLPYSAQLHQLLDEIDDVCAAEGDMCPDILQVCSSVDQLCLHRCERHECGNHGVCVVTHISGQARPSCQCGQDPDSVYERVGARCEEETMRWQWVLGISTGVGGLLVLALLVTLCLRRRRQTRIPYSNNFRDGDMYMNEYKADSETTNTQLHDTGRSNQGYLSDDATYRYEGNPAGLSFLHHTPVYPSPGRPGEEKFKIQRPSLRA